MFKDFEVISYYDYSGYGFKHNYTVFTIKIIDDDFEEIITININYWNEAKAVVSAFDELYSSNDELFLNNLALLVLKIKEKSKFSEYYLLDDFIYEFPKFEKYKEELEKLLLFI